MTLFHNTFEGGTPNGQITTTNSGGTSGDPFDFVFYNNTSYPSGNPNLIYSAAAAVDGSLGARITPGSTVTYLAWVDSDGGGSRAVARRPVRFAANPTASASLVEIRSSPSSMASAKVRTTGKIQAYNRVGTALTGSDFQLSPDTLYWMELAATKGTLEGEALTSTNGRIEMKVFAANGTTQLFSWDSGLAVDAGVDNVESVRWPAGTSAAGWATDDLDEIQFNSNKPSGWLGLYAPDPVVTLVSDKSTIFPGETATLTATASIVGGTITSVAWDASSGTLTGSGLTRTIFAPPSLDDEAIVVTVTATGSTGTESTAVVTVTRKASMTQIMTADGPLPIVEYLMT